ncbi:DUF2202 domain-containing protein [Methylobacter sp. YRD-M1]|uniref:DUF2202 domain-containing protein n=1 Tax=Methylobacter sp. YRD-M1 TaxID=2911520 RepID=UPI00227C9D7C|nr:DUF2202 domain-containing protein [Methylobacter sp. YRD-M1]WAK03506.1 DUF2202 domain-containing protein [Methylobacter sp. YRD-M1]
MLKFKASITSAALCLIFFTASAHVYAGQKNAGGSNQALSSTETESVLFMREEEKMARDVYLTLYDFWNDQVFLNIYNSEQKHMDAVKQLLDKYGLKDPAIGGVGLFSNPDLQGLYDELIAQGEKSAMEAFHVGALIEEVDIRDIQAVINAMTHSDIVNVYENLLQGSRNHLKAFVGKIEANGVDYQAQVLTQQEVDEIVAQQ